MELSGKPPHAAGPALTEREMEVLDCVSHGLTNREIGQKLRISARTAEVHRSNMLAKLGARNSADAVRISIAAGLIGAELAPSAPPLRTLAVPARVTPRGTRTLRASVRRQLASGR